MVSRPTLGLTKWFFEAWGTEAKKPHLFRKSRRWQGPKNNMFHKMCGLFATVPQASKNHLAKTNFGIHLI